MLRKYPFSIFIIVISCGFWVYGQKLVSINSKCVTKETCGECIQEKDCMWCSKPISSEPSTTPFIKCIDKKDYTPEWCNINLITDPKPFELKYIQNKPLGSGSSKTDPTQITPQQVSLKLRRGQEYELHFQYASAVDYPVDLYYLMDLSASMADDRDNLSRLGDRLAEVMKNITRNFRLGFGSFIDKTDSPFISIVPSKVKQPCTIAKTGEKCVPAYSYRNHLSLTEDTSLFKMEVQRAPASGNLDAPEGGFDAILQAIVCQKEIGWRPKARHLLIFSTDAGFHLAGDGKLAGIVEPHDGNCYLNEQGLYTHALKFDYPSISFINRYVKKHNINLIFAVTKEQTETYKTLSRVLNGASFGTLDQDSSNVVDLVRGVYDKLVDSVTFTDNAGSLIEIKYYSSCSEDLQDRKETRECGGIRYGKKVSFVATIKVVECPKDRNMWKQTFEIKPMSFNESLRIDLEVICGCPCENNLHHTYVTNSSICNNKGDLQCGVCSCPSGQFGRFCECDQNTLNPGLEAGSNAGCRATNETKDICSRHGTCICGQCQCDKRKNADERYYGRHCECNNFSCKRHSGVLCSGHGTCDCGVCKCDAGWSGPACECKDSIDSCIQPGEKEVCSGKGTCECGACKCKSEPFRYSGRFCEECPTCPGQRCDEFKDCVECQAFNNTGKYSAKDCARECTRYSTIVVDKIEIPKSDRMVDEVSGNTSKICKSPDNAGCTIIFEYKYDALNNIEKVYAQKDKECPIEINLYAAVIAVIATVVIIGIITLLIWKCLTEIHDRREYVRFEKERQMARWDRGDNPLYKPSTTTFKNPTFGQSE